jgi:CBS domain-containing protein
MIICPSCHAENIEGADECGECSQPLTEMGLRVPSSSVEADLLRDRIERLWPKTPSTVSPTTTVGEVLKKMVSETIGCVMVVDRGQLVGIFSERDALMKLNVDAAKSMNKPISQFMTERPVTLDTNDKIAFALHKMNLGGYRHLPILFNGKLAGVISIRDILRYLTERIAVARPVR